MLVTPLLCFSPGKHADTGWEIWGAAHVMQTSDSPPDMTKLKQVALSGAFESKMWTTWSWGFFWYHTKCSRSDGVCEVKDITSKLKFACGFHSLASLNLEDWVLRVNMNVKNSSSVEMPIIELTPYTTTKITTIPITENTTLSRIRG